MPDETIPEVPEEYADLIPASNRGLVIPIPVELSARLILPLVIVLIVVVSLLLVQVGNLIDDANESTKASNEAKSATVENREIGYKNRAVNCSILTSIGGAGNLPSACKDPQALRYYDPEAIIAAPSFERQEFNTELLCRLVYGDQTPTQEDCVNSLEDQ